MELPQSPRPRRKRINTERARSEPSGLSDRIRYSYVFDLEQQCNILRERSLDLTERLEHYHIQMQKARGETERLQNRIKGILQHIRMVVDQQVIPGAKLKKDLDDVQRENKLLKWKLGVTERYLFGILPEFAQPDPEL